MTEKYTGFRKAGALGKLRKNTFSDVLLAVTEYLGFRSSRVSAAARAAAAASAKQITFGIASNQQKLPERSRSKRTRQQKEQQQRQDPQQQPERRCGV
jgi:hypothetical protein